MYYPIFQQNNDDEQQYHIVKEAVKAALHQVEQLRPDQKQRLAQELVQEKGMEGLLNRLYMLFSRR